VLVAKRARWAYDFPNTFRTTRSEFVKGCLLHFDATVRCGKARLLRFGLAERDRGPTEPPISFSLGMSIAIYCGHAPGHVRSAFEEAVEVMVKWNGREPEPKVDFEVNYEPRKISLLQACKLVSRCTDTLPGWIFDELQEFGLKGGTYAAGAKAWKVGLKQSAASVISPSSN
jgi:hypothetical protein